MELFLDFLSYYQCYRKYIGGRWELWNVKGLVFFLTFTDSILHMVQDWFIWRLYGKFKRSIPYQEDYWFYTTIAIDQAIHLFIRLYFASLMLRWL